MDPAVYMALRNVRKYHSNQSYQKLIENSTITLHGKLENCIRAKTLRCDAKRKPVAGTHLT